MISIPKRCFTAAALFIAIAAASAGTPATDQKAAPAPTSPASPPATAVAPGLESLKIPDNAVLVVVEKSENALKMIPKAVVLTPEKYNELLAELKRLRASAPAEKPAAPGRCELSGKAEGGVLALKAVFDFRVERVPAEVRLGCPQARADEVSLEDGHKPLLRSDPSDGYTVVVDKPGEHRLTLELKVALAPRGAGRGVELDLPRAAVTKLDLELPPGSRNLQLGGKALNDPMLEFKDNVLKGLLPASADRLDLAWAGPAAGPGTLLAVGNRIQVRVDGQTVTVAELHLQRQGGESDAWKVLVPPGAEVKLAAGEEDRLAGVDADDKTYGPFASLRTVRLKGPATSVKVLVTAHGPRPNPGKPVPVGPFAAVGATLQKGTLLVSSAAPGVRLDLQRRGDLARRPPTAEESQNDPGLVAAFDYWGVPPTDKPAAATGPGSLSLLDIEAETIRGLVEARVSHALQLTRDATGARRWRLKTRIEATPVRSGVEQVRVWLPPGFRYAADSGSADPAVRPAEFDEKSNELTFRLIGADSKSFTLAVEGDYPNAEPDAGRALLALPRPLDTRDLGGLVTVAGPDDLELRLTEAANPTLEAAPGEGPARAWRSPRFPERVEVEWRAFQPEIQVTSEADLTLTAGEGHVRQTLRFRFARSAPEQITLHVPPAVAGRLKVVRGGSPGAHRLLGAVRAVDLRAPGEPAPGRDVTLVLEYSFELPDGQPAGPAVPVPLVRPEAASRGETKVRVWADPGAAPLPPGGAWSAEQVEEVDGRDRLPALVLRAQRLDTPLALATAPPEGPAVTVLTERVLVRAAVTEGGGQSYRTGFLLERLETRYLDVELPAPAAGLGLRVTLGGKQVAWDAVDDDGQLAAGGRVARLRLSPQLVKRGSILEVAFDLPPGRAATGLLQTTLTPPLLRGDPGRVPTRWLVQLPPGWVPLAPEGGPGQERTWSRRGWLVAPRPSVTEADLERWLAGPEALAGAGVKADESAAAPSLTCWRDRPESLRITHAPQQAWLLACSLVTLGLGLALYVLTRNGLAASAAWLLPVLAVAGAGLVVAGLFWPTTVAAVAFGVQPGAAVLAVAAPLLWLQHERQRRRSAFPASFSRSRSASPSSLLRTGGVRVPGEPSTVDVPRPGGSSPPRSSPELPRLEGSGSGKGGRELQGSGGPGS